MASQLKTLKSFFNCFSVVRCVVQDKLMYYRALHCKGELFGVWWITGGLFHVTHFVTMDPFRAIYYYKRRRKFDKSISTPKLSALQHRCLRFLLLLKWIQGLLWTEMRYSFDQRWFFKYGANPRRAQIKKRHPHVDNESANETCACQPKHLIYLSVDVKPCPCVSTWATTVLFPSLPPSSVSPSLFLEELLCGYVAENPFLMSLICVSWPGRHNDLFLF